MALSTQTQAACFLLLLLASLTSGLVLPRQTSRQLADLRTQDTAGAATALTPVPQRLRRRDTHFPICMYCCGCCIKSRCGICCRT